MPSKPFEPYALQDILKQLEKQHQRLERSLNIPKTKPKKQGWLKRLFGW